MELLRGRGLSICEEGDARRSEGGGSADAAPPPQLGLPAPSTATAAAAAASAAAPDPPRGVVSADHLLLPYSCSAQHAHRRQRSVPSFRSPCPFVFFLSAFHSFQLAILCL